MVERLSWRRTREHLRADAARLAELRRRDGVPAPPLACLDPAWLAVALYRVARYLEGRGHRRAARWVAAANQRATGVHLEPDADLGPGLVIPFPAGVSIAARAGRNLTVLAVGVLGPDEPAGPERRPVLGDDVLVDHHAGVIGPVRVGSRARIGPGRLVTRDLMDEEEVPAEAVRHPVTRSGRAPRPG